MSPRLNPIAGVTKVSWYAPGNPPIYTRSGHELTEEDLEALSAEAEAGDDSVTMRASRPASVARPALGRKTRGVTAGPDAH